MREGGGKRLGGRREEGREVMDVRSEGGRGEERLGGR